MKPPTRKPPGLLGKAVDDGPDTEGDNDPDDMAQKGMGGLHKAVTDRMRADMMRRGSKA